MKNFYEKELLISATYVDQRCEVGVFQAALLVQDGMTEMFHQYQCDALRMSKTHGALWAVARTKLFYERDVFWMDRVRLKAFPVKVSSVAVHLNFLLETLDGTPLIRGRQEMCAIDVDGHSLRRVETTPFPMDMELLPPVFTEPYQRRKLKLGEEDLVYRYRVRTMDTDMNGHLNNVNYIRLLLDVRPSAFWDAHRVRDFDIHYVNEGMEGDALEVCCQEEEGLLSVLIKCGETSLVKAFLVLEDRV